MIEKVISVTEAARNFADCVNRVRYQDASFVLHKNGVPVARLVPVTPASGAQQESPDGAPRHGRNEVNQDEEAATASQNPQPADLPKRPILNW